MLEEKSATNGVNELFFIDNWCLVGSLHSAGNRLEPSLEGQHRFDYDSYKILYAYLTDKRNQELIRPALEKELIALRSQRKIPK